MMIPPRITPEDIDPLGRLGRIGWVKLTCQTSADPPTVSVGFGLECRSAGMTRQMALWSARPPTQTGKTSDVTHDHGDAVPLRQRHRARPDFTISRVETGRRNPYCCAVSVPAMPKPRVRVLHRFTCARIGHYWATDGTGAHGVCLRCGKHVEPVAPRVTAAFDEPVQHRDVATTAPPQAGAALGEGRASSTGPSDDVSEVVPAHRVGSAEQPITDGHSERRAASLPSVTLAVVSLAVLGGAAYLALRRRKRRSR